MINTFAYGIPFISNKIFFEADCNCKRIKKARMLCKELDRNDPLEGMKDINLAGIILDSNTYNDINKKNKNINKNRNKKSTYSILSYLIIIYYI